MDGGYDIYRQDVGMLPLKEFFFKVHAPSCPTWKRMSARSTSPPPARERAGSVAPSGRAVESCIHGGTSMFCCCVLFCV
jgi:hypothetical protein